MSPFQALVLGVVQGLAEFLPVSSSGHLKLAEYLFGLQLEDLVAFDVLVHVGTLVATVYYFRADLSRVGKAFVASLGKVCRRGGWSYLETNAEAKWGWLVGLTLVPTGVVAVLCGDLINRLAEIIPLVAVMLMVTGCLNWYAARQLAAQRPGRRIEQLGVVDALVCGLAQAVALMHGISRSGSTIAAGLSRGLDRDAAPRFAFLMAVPAIFAAAVVELPGLAEGEQVSLAAGVIGFVAAMLTGYWALKTIFEVVKRGRLTGFAYYCWLIGALGLVVSLIKG